MKEINMEDKILVCKNVSTSYQEKKGFFGTNTKMVEVCHDISFEIGKGEIVGLVGESGCGKSTLAKTILGMIKDYEGNIECSCERPQMVFQDPYASLNPAKKIGWILQEPLRMKGGFTKEEMVSKAEKMLKRVGLSKEVMERYPRQLSGGQRQRVCIGVALMLEPALLIADEPVSALDVTIQKQVVELIMKLKDELGLAILFISHDLRLVYRMCDRVLIMKEGTIIEQGDVDAVYRNPKEAYTKALLKAAGIA